LTDCAQGGSAYTSSEHADAGEVAKAAFDDDSRTKWLATESAAWLRYQAAAPCAARFYTLTSADDEPARDPKEWVVEGSNDGDTWIALDQRQHQNFAFRHQTRVYQLSKDAAFQNYRLRFTANHGDPELQLAEVEFLSVRGEGAIAQPSAATQTQPALPQDESLFTRLVTRLDCSVSTPGSHKPLGSFGLLALALFALVLRRISRS
jgi:MYXO-CTERM domain-containing protein